MWLAEVKAKAKRKNQILFSKDSLLLTDLCQLIAQANRRALILWALELAEELPRAIPPCEAHRGMGAADMADCIITGEAKPRCSMYIARHITEALLAFDISAKSGEPYNMTTTCERPDPVY